MTQDSAMVWGVWGNGRAFCGLGSRLGWLGASKLASSHCKKHISKMKKWQEKDN